jgi:hypothetical protein
MAYVKRVRVVVEVQEDDGSVTVNEAVGAPHLGQDIVINMVPDWRTQIRRSTGQVLSHEVAQVAIRLSLTLVPNQRDTLFRETHGDKPVLTLTESPAQA